MKIFSRHFEPAIGYKSTSMTRIVVLLFFGFLLASCGGEQMTKSVDPAIDTMEEEGADLEFADLEQIENKDIYGYLEQYARSKNNYAKQGIYKKFNPEGVLVEEASYREDTLDGFRIIFYEKGDTQIIEQYKMGVFEGIYKDLL